MRRLFPGINRRPSSSSPFPLPPSSSSSAAQTTEPPIPTTTTSSGRSAGVDKALAILQLVLVPPPPKHHHAPTTSPQNDHLSLIHDFFHTGPNARHLFGQVPRPQQLPQPVSLQQSHHESHDSDADADADPVVDAFVLSRALTSRGSARDLRAGIQFHCLALKTGHSGNSYVGSSLITFYCRCARLGDARQVLDDMPIPAKNVVSWTAIISGYAQEWRVDACLSLYHSMRCSGSNPNDLTFVALLGACMGSGALGLGRSFHCQAVRVGFNSHTHVANSLVSMYCKCGHIEDAVFIFRDMPGRDIVSWNSMIAGHAQFGQAIQAIELFEEMKQRNVRPDRITFLAVLSSCRHAGLLELGLDYFESMAGHGVEPEVGHYSCIVDLLGRSRKLEEARSFIERMPMSPNALIWGSLLSSCRVHGSVWIGIEAAESKLLLEPRCAATHVQLANLYASVGHWGEAARVRKLMKVRGLRTTPGYSWIEISNKVHRFRAEDVSNNSVVLVLSILDCLMDHMRSFDYSSGVYQDEDDQGIPCVEEFD